MENQEDITVDEEEMKLDITTDITITEYEQKVGINIELYTY